MRTKIFLVKSLFISGLIFMSCTKGDNIDIITPSVEMADLTIQLSNLEELGDDFIYEGWIVVAGSPISVGTFDAALDEYTFTTVASDLAAATRFVITIEPSNDTDSDPSGTFILGGDFTSNRADLSLDEIADFAEVSGNFEIFTPSDMDDTNEENGIWFLTTNTTDNTFEAGLELPVLPDGWRYEAWVVFENDGVDIPVSTGAFSDPASFDDLSEFSGERSAPEFPGQGFLSSSVTVTNDDGTTTTLTFPDDGNVTNLPVFVSVEPFPDNDPAAFFIQPLEGLAGREISPAANELFRNSLNLNTIAGTATR